MIQKVTLFTNNEVLLKKSYDYFKTLKEMSLAVCSSYGKMTLNQDFNSEVIKFSGLKWELSDNLLSDFVAPIERNDIYNLALCLSEELYYVSKLSKLACAYSFSRFNFIESITGVLRKQATSLYALRDSKNSKKLFREINEMKATLNGVNSSIILLLRNNLNEAEKNAIDYVVADCFFDIYKSIDHTFSQVQKAIINNN